MAIRLFEKPRARSAAETLGRKMRQLEAAGPAPERSCWSLPAQHARLHILNNIMDLCDYGVRLADGELYRLTPSEKEVLTLICRVKLELRDFYGPLDAPGIAQSLGMSLRSAQAALRSLKALQLILERRSAYGDKDFWLDPELMDVRRPRHADPRALSYPQREQRAPRGRKTQKFAPPLYSIKQAELCENPLPPSAAPPAALDPGPPSTPTTEKAETLRQGLVQPNTVPPSTDGDSQGPGSGKPSNGHKRQRQQGDDHSGAPPSAWTRMMTRLTQLSPFHGLAPPG